MKQSSLLLIFLALVLTATFTAHAQGAVAVTGCDSSPENPTVILALVGSAGGLCVSLRARLKTRSK